MGGSGLCPERVLKIPVRFLLLMLFVLCCCVCSGILMDVKRDSRVLSLVNRAGLKGTLSQMLDQLQRCQKSLNEFLEVFNLFLATFL